MKENTWSNPMTEVIKWTLVGVLLVVGVYISYLEAWPFYLRALALIGAMMCSGLMALSTGRGQAFILFLQSARNELRKVVWPTRQETIQVSIIVVVMVLIMSLILWSFDLVLFKLMAWLTGQGV